MKKSDALPPKVVAELLGRQHGPTKKLLWTMAKDGELRADAKGRYSFVNGGNPSNPVTLSVTEGESEVTQSNQSGNPKSSKNPEVFSGNGSRVTTVTGVTGNWE